MIDEIRDAIGRNVTFLIEEKEDCPTCTLDPNTLTSTDSFCPTCSGKGYIITLSGVITKAHITWGPADVMNWSTGGQYIDGDCRIQIEYIPENVTITDTAKYVDVDGKRLTIRKKIFRGVPSLTRILLDLKELEE